MADDLIEKLWFCANLHPQCGYPENGKLFGAAADRITALQAQNRKLVEALKPFAMEHSTLHGFPDDRKVEAVHMGNHLRQVRLTAGDFKRARSAIAEAEKGVG